MNSLFMVKNNCSCREEGVAGRFAYAYVIQNFVQKACDGCQLP